MKEIIGKVRFLVFSRHSLFEKIVFAAFFQD